MHACSHQHRAARGFTLVELVCCLVIMAVLAAISGPKFFSSQSFQERGYVDEIAAALRLSQRVAIASGCEVSVTVNGAGYQAAQRAAGACNASGAWNVAVSQMDGTALAGTAPSSVGSTPAIQVIFDSRGRVANGAPAPLRVGAFTLTVDAGSGLVVVQ